MSSATPEPIWLVTGLRPPSPRFDPWQAAVVRRVLNQLDQETSGEGTRLAQEGLELPDSCYWYVQRAEGDYGYVIFLYDDRDAIWGGDINAEGGACPFDTGGVWHGHLEADPPLGDAAAKVHFVRAHQGGLDVWRPRFTAWLQEHYDAELPCYVSGDEPTRAPLPFLAAPSPINNRLCWTWEVRVRRDQAHRVTPARLFVTRPDLLALLDWVDRSGGARSGDIKAWLAEPGRVTLCDVVVAETQRVLCAG